MARFLALVLIVGSALGQNVVHYNTTADNVKYLFATAPPVARLHSGDILDTNTLDCFGNVVRKPGDTLSMVKGDNPLAGPFYVEGAEPGDTLAVKILDLQVDGDTGVGAFAPGFGALNETNYTPMLHSSAQTPAEVDVHSLRRFRPTGAPALTHPREISRVDTVVNRRIALSLGKLAYRRRRPPIIVTYALDLLAGAAAKNFS